MALAARHLWFRYGRRLPWVLEDVSIRIEPGEVVGLWGVSGSGKSTLGRVLAGMRRPEHGSVVADDGSPTSTGAHPVQLVLQHPEHAMDPRWKVGEILAEPGAPGDERSAITAELVHDGWADRFPHEISGGELQRVNLARALLARPRYLVADEITSSLDPIVQARIWHLLLEQVRTGGVGLLAVSHDRALLDVVADRIVEFESLGGGRPPGEPASRFEDAHR